VLNLLVPAPIIDNIGDFNKYRAETFIEFARALFAKVAKTPGRDVKSAIVEILYLYISKNMDIIHRSPKFALVIKAKAEELIMKDKLISLIPYYNLIYTDKMYDNVGPNYTLHGQVLIDEEDINKLVKQYNEEVADRVKRQSKLRLIPKFEEGEIVGAKDKEGKWWMSKVLKVFTHLEHNMYYVEFLGWGTKFNEFITDSYRIARFNPRIHIYYRPAWKKKNIEHEHVHEHEQDLVQ
jgi:hypothetical protein